MALPYLPSTTPDSVGPPLLEVARPCYGAVRHKVQAVRPLARCTALAGSSRRQSYLRLRATVLHDPKPYGAVWYEVQAACTALA
jgi:hypothetical protein